MRDDAGHWNWLIDRQAVKANYRHLGEANQAGDHGPHNGDVLFIIGSESDYVRPEHREAILALFPNVQVKIIEGTGHWLHAEKPAAFNRLVLRFLQS